MDDKFVAQELWSSLDKPLSSRPLHEMEGGYLGIRPAEQYLKRERAQVDKKARIIANRYVRCVA